MKRNLLMIAGIATLLLGACSENTPEKAVEGFYSNLQKGDMATALTYTNTTEQQAEAIISILDAAHLQVLEYAIEDCHIDDGDSTATVTMCLKVSSDQTDGSAESHPTLPCVKQDGEWKVMFI